VSAEQADLFASHMAELQLWNRKMNLTAITDPLEAAIKHFLDSIAAVPIIGPDQTILDIGSGAGFPGIPLKIMLPASSVFLMEASRKKAAFLNHLVRLMKLQNITVLQARAEYPAQETSFKNRFDVIVCRALAELKTFVGIAYPLLSEKGFLLAYKGHVPVSEIEELKNPKEHFPGSEIPWAISVRTYRLPYLNQARSLVIIRKG